MTRTRRRFLQDGGLAAAVLDVPSPWQAALNDTADLSRQVRIDPRPLFAISPLLHLQFMEPLGTTDSSVEAAWDRESDNWREDFVLRARELAPQVLRFGGLFSRYYRWREGVGPARKRPVMRNRVWGGLESNRIGTDELVGLCRSIGAQPLFNVNFLGDGHHEYMTGSDGYRVGGAGEAADWVTYCNDPDSVERRQHGRAESYRVGLWQIGNETSYGAGGFAKDEAIARTVEFAREMRRRDPSIRLIGWGDGDGRELWAGDMVRRAGEQLDFIAVHMMQQLPTEPDTVLRGMLYQREPDRAWEELLALSRRPEARLVELEQELDATGTPLPIAVTEGHLSLTPHNTNPILLEWLSGAYHARMLNLYQRHGDRVRIATVADFNGTRWTTVAVRLQVPRGISYLTPAGSVMRLFGRYNGTEAVSVTATPPELDIAASRSGDRIYLHVANLDGARSIAVEFQVEGRSIAGGRVLAIAPEDLRTAVDQDNPEVFAPTENVLIGTGWRFPKGSVSVVELELR